MALYSKSVLYQHKTSVSDCSITLQQFGEYLGIARIFYICICHYEQITDCELLMRGPLTDKGCTAKYLLFVILPVLNQVQG